MSDMTSPSCAPGMNMLRNISLQGYAAPQIIRIGQEWVNRFSPTSDPLMSGGRIAIAALIREAYDRNGSAYASMIANIFEREVKDERSLIRQWKAFHREQATGSTGKSHRGGAR
ncbi:hypothetical protein J2D73_19270 [Acetobacter sacchari]|uniref:Uncharacterized protein n=1 Tax=Acetobacter sacchari TaxID=2661687 RepID=A0ABS3M160_9PROT|nr:hypothetical protein [Acetobacter sacchari]MBO1361927.1 hypothetical protein [Acetobacter sacchari]